MKKQNSLVIIIGILFIMGTFKCPLYNILGIPCPTCGMTRSWQHFLTMDFTGAFLMHPLFFLPLIFLIPKARKKWVLFAVFGIFIAVYILRMILLFPHTPPMNFNHSSLLGELLK